MLYGITILQATMRFHVYGSGNDREDFGPEDRLERRWFWGLVSLSTLAFSLLLPAMSMPKYSVVIPVYNRPQELDELLQSLTHQTFKNFEVLIIDDGSDKRSDEVFGRFALTLSVKYFYKQNSGPGPSRNFGFQHAAGDYLVVFDSDCVLPPNYFDAVEQGLSENNLDMWGGPDRGRGDFTPLQQAMGYTMSSMLTTGGIRGGKKSVAPFQPRSFNMGFNRNVYLATGGFKFDRYAEDIELSLRAMKLGFKVGLIEEAFVYHKRRSTLGEFFGQVSNFGKGRVLVGRQHNEAIRVTHWFPFFFTVGLAAIPFLWIFLPRWGGHLTIIYIAYLLAVAFDAWRNVKNAGVAFLSIPCAVVQLTGYGLGFFKETISPSSK
jgi:glycosyltransferase involved in cell wall biosynthesis